MKESTTQREALKLSARVGARGAAQIGAVPKELLQTREAFEPLLFVVVAVKAREEIEVLSRAEIGIDHRLVSAISDLRAETLRLRRRLISEVDLATGRAPEKRHEPKERTFSAPVLAFEVRDLSRTKRVAHAAKSAGRPVRFHEPLDGDLLEIGCHGRGR